MWLILQQDHPDDYVIATGETHTVREFVEIAFGEVGRRIVWRGAGTQEQGVDANTGQVLVSVDARYFRPTEVDYLHGNPAKARARLGWRHTTSFKDLVAEMVASDLVTVKEEHERTHRQR
jgi:GDPmannose 4,6-dehydratase